MAEAHAKNHDYHILEPSPWPLIGAVSAFLMASGFVTWWKDIEIAGMHLGPFIFGAGIIGVLYTMISWWTDVVREANTGSHTRVVQLHHRYGMIMFIASEVMFFVAWFWAYFEAALYPNEPLQYQRLELTGGSLPPQGVQAYEYGHAAFGFGGNIYGSTFFMATGFHGAHVIIGTIFLAVCLLRVYRQ